ncbi:inositol monophosphatase family protein [Solemya velum gill symbiont]|uniref:Fructose-1,6-bisphosphatase-like protein n=1 Tax=Solemya velum gill symbiont TaxID=2340 RepID=A0A0B0H9H0_SOVGS|nr:inositol monophosphatase [Solemya velum gill symbiont]KHF25292.1 fructose-1,6-bisphosphatase-like protein [Solemya velum gill symbiont]OOY35165.1 inositol monophosphatase [Solemya velum gill symbiont]OOY37819.1 inositol monophosphatase [Solemya velum gill symbiont]OOY41114.1 inositol monophosphatase [Solemya velum gill symbiont]OOY42395.1 inositol monophosphatase [Solemya velum gill symbiont]
MIDVTSIAALLKSVAQQELLPRFAQIEPGVKPDGSLVTEADLESQRLVASRLEQDYPHIGFLGEEMSAQQQESLLASGEPLFCLDPLDGTTNFVSGVPYFCISLSLIQSGRVTHGIVYDPLRDELYTAGQGRGAFLNGKRLQARDTGLSLKQTSALIDFKRLPPQLAARLVTEIPYASQRSFGSVALDLCWLATGRVHLYLHGASSLWDYGAGSLVCNEAGCQTTTLEGETLFVNRLEKRSAVGAVDQHLFDAWIKWLGIPG